MFCIVGFNSTRWISNLSKDKILISSVDIGFNSTRWISNGGGWILLPDGKVVSTPHGGLATMMVEKRRTWEKKFQLHTVD